MADVIRCVLQRSPTRAFGVSICANHEVADNLRRLQSLLHTRHKHNVAACSVAYPRAWRSPPINIMMDTSFAVQHPLDNAYHGIIPVRQRGFVRREKTLQLSSST